MLGTDADVFDEMDELITIFMFYLHSEMTLSEMML